VDCAALSITLSVDATCRPSTAASRQYLLGMMIPHRIRTELADGLEYLRNDRNNHLAITYRVGRLCPVEKLVDALAVLIVIHRFRLLRSSAFIFLATPVAMSSSRLTMNRRISRGILNVNRFGEAHKPLGISLLWIAR
jgi:hypothetical protein